jgi:hypothetical protein
VRGGGLDTGVRAKLIWWSVLGGSCVTLLAITLQVLGVHKPVIWLSYPGVYFMQAFFARFLEWLPWEIGDNAIAETITFFTLNTAGYGFVIFLVLRIFMPDRSGELGSIVEGE